QALTHRQHTYHTSTPHTSFTPPRIPLRRLPQKYTLFPYTTLFRSVDKSGAIEIAKQLRAIGNNVNQLTKRANASNGKIDSEELQAIKKELHKIWQQFN